MGVQRPSCLGPKPASLSALEHLGIDSSQLNIIIDHLFRFDSASPPQLLPGGSLRSGVEAAFATQVMYYPGRFQDGEMLDVLTQMRDSMSACGFGQVYEGGGGGSASGQTPLNGPHLTLQTWSIAIRTQFALENGHLSGGPGADASL